jgi:hypothetical protein
MSNTSGNSKECHCEPFALCHSERSEESKEQVLLRVSTYGSGQAPRSKPVEIASSTLSLLTMTYGREQQGFDFINPESYIF